MSSNEQMLTACSVAVSNFICLAKTFPDRVLNNSNLLITMLNRAHCLSSSPDLFAEEYDNLKGIFLKLKYPENIINSTITRFIESRNQPQVCDVQANAPVRISLPFKDQRSADVVRRQLSDLGKKINSYLRPVFTSKKIADDIKVAEAKPPLINQQCVVYKFKCDLCDADYVGYTCRHLFQRIEEHKHSAIGKHLRDAHNQKNKDLQEQFTILRNVVGNLRLDCRIPGPPNVPLKKSATAVPQSCLTMLLPRPLNVLLKNLPP